MYRLHYPSPTTSLVSAKTPPSECNPWMYFPTHTQLSPHMRDVAEIAKWKVLAVAGLEGQARKAIVGGGGSGATDGGSSIDGHSPIRPSTRLRVGGGSSAGNGRPSAAAAGACSWYRRGVGLVFVILIFTVCIVDDPLMDLRRRCVLLHRHRTLYRCACLRLNTCRRRRRGAEHKHHIPYPHHAFRHAQLRRNGHLTGRKECGHGVSGDGECVLTDGNLPGTAIVVRDRRLDYTQA